MHLTCIASDDMYDEKDEKCESKKYEDIREVKGDITLILSKEGKEKKMEGIDVSARTVRGLDDKVKDLIRERNVLRKQTQGIVKMFKNAIPERFIRFLNRLNDVEQEIDTCIAEIHVSAADVVAGMRTIEQIAKTHIKTTKEYRVAETLKGCLIKISTLSGICSQASKIIQKASGTDQDINEARGLFSRNATELGVQRKEYHEARKVTPKWLENLPNDLKLGALNVSELKSINERMDEYIRIKTDEFLVRNYPDYFMPKKRTFYEMRANPQWTGEQE